MLHLNQKSFAFGSYVFHNSVITVLRTCNDSTFNFLSARIFFSASLVVRNESYWMLVFSDVALCRYHMFSFMEFFRHLRKVT